MKNALLISVLLVVAGAARATGTQVDSAFSPFSAQGITVSGAMINTSARGYIGPESDVLVIGFVVRGESVKTMLIRAVGLSLSQFGIELLLPDPEFTIYDETGKVYDGGFAYPQIGRGLTPERHLQQATLKAGAFHLQAGSKDAVQLLPIPPGAYTIVAKSASGLTGVVLLEVYDVPE